MELGPFALTQTGFIYVVIGSLCIEAVALLALWYVNKKGLRPAQVISFLGAGGSFAAALLIVAKDGSLYALAASLGFAFMFHLLDIVQRWQK